MKMKESLLLARHISSTNYEDIPPAAIDRGKKSFMDALAVMLAAGTLGEGCREFVQLAVSSGGKEESTILGFGKKAPAVMAVFANGSMAHALDFEDSHDGALVHPNAATIPAALAVSELLGNVSGKDFLTAVVLGSDIVCRLGLAIEDNLLEYGWYMPPIMGAFGAAAAASKLLKLTEGQVLDAFSLTLCQATCSAELIHNPHSVVRSIRDAFSAKAGVISAMLARQGITGFAEPLEGKAGFFSAYARGNYSSLQLTENLGKVFEGANVSFKPWPSCRGTHSCIDAVLQIVDEHGLHCDDVEKIRVVVSPVNRMLCEPLSRKQRPELAIDAKFSIPFVVATALYYGRVSLEHFTSDSLKNEAVLDIAQRVSYEIDDTLSRSETVHSYVEIKTGNATFSKKVTVPYGHPENPMSQEALVAKFMDCAGYSSKILSGEKLDNLVDLLVNLDQQDNIACITEHL